jgi:large subunit ribosomal protein L16
MLAPGKVKWRKQQKGKMRGVSKGGTSVSFGEFGLQALEMRIRNCTPD